MTPQYMPTPEQIAEECLAIQATWSEQERYGRHVLLPTQLYSAPYYEREVDFFPAIPCRMLSAGQSYLAEENVRQVEATFNNIVN
jgi:hypothetical protein